jgi:hypothetical protein
MIMVDMQFGVSATDRAGIGLRGGEFLKFRRRELVFSPEFSQSMTTGF